MKTFLFIVFGLVLAGVAFLTQYFELSAIWAVITEGVTGLGLLFASYKLSPAPAQTRSIAGKLTWGQRIVLWLDDDIGTWTMWLVIPFLVGFVVFLLSGENPDNYQWVGPWGVVSGIIVFLPPIGRFIYGMVKK